jgi:hypothetical protein
MESNRVFAGGTTTNLINNDGVLSAPENNVFAIDNANATPLITPMIFFSYTLGGNYLLNTKQSLFARVSRGASAK